MTAQDTEGKPTVGHRAPRRALPTRRVLVRTQLRLAAAGAELSGARLTAFHINAVADKAGMAERQASLTTRFLVENNLWKKTGRDIYCVTEEGRRFGALWEADESKARTLLGELLGRSWFAEVAGRVLAHGPVPIERMLGAFQKAAGAADSSMSMVMHLLEWTTVARLTDQTEDGMVTAGPALVCAEPTAPGPEDEAMPDESVIKVPPQKEPDVPAAPNSAQPDARFALDVDVRLTMEEMSCLAPEELGQFMAFLNAVRRARQEVSAAR